MRREEYGREETEEKLWEGKRRGTSCECDAWCTY
jgi:hypothetical protein